MPTRLLLVLLLLVTLLVLFAWPSPAGAGTYDGHWSASAMGDVHPDHRRVEYPSGQPDGDPAAEACMVSWAP
jgi:hypothetical protein